MNGLIEEIALAQLGIGLAMFACTCGLAVCLIMMSARLGEISDELRKLNFDKETL